MRRELRAGSDLRTSAGLSRQVAVKLESISTRHPQLQFETPRPSKKRRGSFSRLGLDRPRLAPRGGGLVKTELVSLSLSKRRDVWKRAPGRFPLVEYHLHVFGRYEAKVYRGLTDSEGVPSVRWNGVVDKYNVMARSPTSTR